VEFAGIGGTVHSMRRSSNTKIHPGAEPPQRASASTFRDRSSAAGEAWWPPPFQRFYMGGENDIRGFDIRSVSPVAFPAQRQRDHVDQSGRNSGSEESGQPALGELDDSHPGRPDRVPGGDLSVWTNLEYRITIAGPVAIAPFWDMGIDPIIRRSQLQIAQAQYDQVIGTLFGCPTLDAGYNCQGGSILNPRPRTSCQVLGQTDWRPRASTGLELQMFLPVVNAPFRIYWAYNPLRLNEQAYPPIPITTAMFPQAVSVGSPPGTICNRRRVPTPIILAVNTYSPSFQLREPRKTFRFTVATTF
jgi:outer membrane protein insertion porin family